MERTDKPCSGGSIPLCPFAVGRARWGARPCRPRAGPANMATPGWAWWLPAGPAGPGLMGWGFLDLTLGPGGPWISPQGCSPQDQPQLWALPQATHGRCLARPCLPIPRPRSRPRGTRGPSWGKEEEAWHLACQGLLPRERSGHSTQMLCGVSYKYLLQKCRMI